MDATETFHTAIRCELLRTLHEPLALQRPERLQKLADLLALADTHHCQIAIEVHRAHEISDNLRDFALLFQKIRLRQGGDGLVSLLPSHTGTTLIVAALR